MHRMSSGAQTKKTLKPTRKLNDLKCLLNFNDIFSKDVENPRNFPNHKRVLTVVRSEQESQKIWSMLEETNDVFRTFSPLKIFDKENVKRINQFCSGRILFCSSIIV